MNRSRPAHRDRTPINSAGRYFPHQIGGSNTTRVI